MKESDFQTVGTISGSLVDELDTLFLSLGESFSHTVFHSECDMVHTTASAVLLDEFGNSAFRGCSFEKLNLSVAHHDECSSHFLVFDHFLFVAFKPENILVVFDCLLKIRNGYPDVLDVRNFHVI